MVKYKSTVIEIGDMVADFLNQKMIIIFDETAPMELREMSVIHSGGTLVKDVVTGDTVVFGDTTYEITALGKVANKNLKNIGHVCLKFDARTSPELPGDVHLRGDGIPLIKKGDTILIRSSEI